MTRRSDGFTLIELLVAITLLAVIAVVSWRGLDSLLRSREALVSNDTNLIGLTRAFSQFSSDCAQLADPQDLRRSPVELEADRLLLIRDRVGHEQPTRWQVVMYTVRDGILTRHQSPPVADITTLEATLRTMGSNVDSNGQGTARVHLVEHVAGLHGRTWIEPGGWRSDSAAALSALRNPGTTAVAQAAPAPVVRALELALVVRHPEAGAAQRFVKTCLTGK